MIDNGFIGVVKGQVTDRRSFPGPGMSVNQTGGGA